MSEWRQTTMREVISYFSSGAPILKLEYATAGVPVLAKGDVKPFGRLEHGEKRFIDEGIVNSRGFRTTEPGDHLLTTRDLTQAANFLGLLSPVPTDQAYVVNQGANIVRFIPDADELYLVYWCNAPIYRAYIKSHHVGSTQIHIRKEDFLDSPLWLPDLKEQRAISSILGALDDKIDLNRRMNETLEQTARALFKDWFVDFGPTKAKMAGQAAYLEDDLWGLFPERVDEAGMQEGWDVSTIGQETLVAGGSTPSTKDSTLWDGGISWVTPKDLSALSSPVLLETARHISEEGLTKISSGLLPAGTVLLSSRAPIGYIAIAEIPVAINQGFIAMRCERRLSNVYVWLWTLENMEPILQNANGSTFQEISKRNFRPLSVFVAPESIHTAFDTIAKPLYKRIAQNNREARTLAQTRDLLLPKLMSGELRVRDVEAQVAEVL